MKNNKINLIILGIVALVASFFIFQHEMFAFGGGFIGFGTMALVLGIVQLLSKPETRKATEIEETDERNQAIRGKAAQICSLVSSYLLTALLFILIIFDFYIPAIMLGVVMFINNFVNIFAVNYYNKKM
ncbi:MAG: hypothetical protein ACI4IJ_06755 [Acutalibacteraceae bacterium]